MLNVKILPYPLLGAIKASAKWTDNEIFPSNEDYSREIEKWLGFITSIGEWKRYFLRLTKQNEGKRSETFAEISTAYFLDRLCGFRIHTPEPEGKDKKRGDYLIRIDQKDIFCEVQCPSWQYEFVKEEKLKRQKDTQCKFNVQRLKEPKYKEGCEVQVQAFGSHIKDSINGAYEKLKGDKPSLLILCDNRQHSPVDWRAKHNGFPYPIHEALYHELLKPPLEDPLGRGCFTTNQYHLLSGVLFMRLFDINYKSVLAINPYAVQQLPESFKSIFCK